MDTTITVALITGGCSVLAVIIANFASARHSDIKTAKAQAVTDTKIEELTREVREHNGFAHRLPVVESQLQDILRRLQILESK